VADAYDLSGLVFTSDVPLPELPQLHPMDPRPAECAVHWGDARRHDAPRAPAFYAWITEFGEEWLFFADRPGGYRLTFPEHGEFDVDADGGAVAVHGWPGTPAETMRHLLLNQILPLVLSRRGRIVLHASAVSVKDEVAAFLGRSGAGKSTVAVSCAMRGARIVADDCLVVEPGPRTQWQAVPCRAGVRLWPDALRRLGVPETAGAAAAHYTDKRRVGPGEFGLTFETRTLPLTAFHVLRARRVEDEPVVRHRLSGRDIVMALASEIFRLDPRDAAESRRQFEAISDIAASVRVVAWPRQTEAEPIADAVCSGLV
jgi:hypothetical protein